MKNFLVRLISYSLTFKCGGSTAVVLLVFFIKCTEHVPTATPCKQIDK